MESVLKSGDPRALMIMKNKMDKEFDNSTNKIEVVIRVTLLIISSAFTVQLSF